MSRPCLAPVRIGTGGACHKTRCTLTSHVGELLAAALEVVAVLCLDGVLDGRRHGVVGAENGALDKLDLTGHTTLEAAGDTAGLLALPPGLGGAGLAPLVWRGRTLGGAKVAGRVVAARDGVAGAICRVGGVLGWPVVGIRLGQAVGRVWADVRVAAAVKRVGIGTGGVLVLQEGAANLILVLVAVVLLRSSVYSRVR